MKSKYFFNPLSFVLLILLFGGLSVSVPAQKRDHLTEAEIEIVRDTQELDARTKVFVKAIERRFAALGVLQAETKPAKKEKDNSDWGTPPTGTRSELLGDIAKILEEAMNNLDSVWSREPKNPLVPKALKILSDAAARFQSQAASLNSKVESEKEREAIFQIKRDLENILQAQKDYSAGPGSTS
ncbi:MAG: hypothetical protein M3209_17165 [Acidobacteriota bacterium]|nr:hypothetical protein [Acidobacteriota bacterium]